MPEKTHSPSLETLLAQQVRTHDRDRFLLTLCLPAAQQSRLWPLLAWNDEISRIPEQVSEPMIGHIRYAWWREALGEAKQGKLREHPVLQGVAPLITSGALEMEAMLAMLDAREEQFEKNQFTSLAELEGYLAATSGALLALCLKLCSAEVSGESIRHLGIAWGGAGMLRSLSFMAAQNRSPFPLELLQAHGLRDLANASDDEKHHAAIASSHALLEMAQEHFSKAMEHTVIDGKRFIENLGSKSPHPNPLPLGEGSSGFDAAGEGYAPLVVRAYQSHALWRAYEVAVRHYLGILHKNRQHLLTLPPRAGRATLPLKLWWFVS